MRGVNGDEVPGDVRWKLRRAVKWLRKRGWDRERIGSKTKTSPNTIGNYLSGHRTIPDEFIEDFAGAVAIPLPWFYDGVPSDPPEAAGTEGNQILRKNRNVGANADTERVTWSEIPDWGVVPAGVWAAPDAGGGTAMVPMKLDPEQYVHVTVSGDSMEPRFHHGQRLVVKLSRELRDGVASYVENENRERTLKVARYIEGAGWTLQAINPSTPPISSESAQVIGYVRAILEDAPDGIRL